MCLLMVFTTGCSQQSIHKTTEKGDLAEVERHLQKGEDVNTKDKDGKTPLMYAAAKGHLDAVQYLIAKGADVNASDKDGWTPLMLAGGHLNVINFLISKGADVNARSKDGKTPLMQAALDGHPDAVELLKQQGAKE